MNEWLIASISAAAMAVEAVGAMAILVALFAGLSPYLRAAIARRPLPNFTQVRTRLGRGLVLSLEILIAADVLRTIVHRTLEAVVVLAVIVALRTILSLSLEYEMRQGKTDGPE